MFDINDFKVCVTVERTQILCHILDLNGEPICEEMEDFNLDTIINSNIVQFYTDKDIETYSSSYEEYEIDLISSKEMLEILLSKTNEIKCQN